MKKHGGTYINNQFDNKAVGSTGSPRPQGWKFSESKQAAVVQSSPVEGLKLISCLTEAQAVSLASWLLLFAVHSTRGKSNLQGPTGKSSIVSIKEKRNLNVKAA